MAKYSSGLQPIIDDLTTICTRWMNSGGYNTNEHRTMQITDYSVQIETTNYAFTERNFWTGAGVYPFQEEELAAFCQRNNFTYHLSGRQGNGFHVVIYCKGRDILQKSELLDQWRAQKQAEQEDSLRVARLLPLAEKFYHSDVFREMADVLGTVSDNYILGRELNFTYQGFKHPKFRGSLISFSFLGYRDLANDDELIAFVIACTAKYYCTTPSNMDPKGIERIKVEMWNAQRTIRFLPKYMSPLPNIKSDPVPKKDFF